MTAPKMLDIQSAVPVARASYDLPDAPLAMPEQDLRSARAAAQAGQTSGWLTHILRGLRSASAPQGTARS